MSTETVAAADIRPTTYPTVTELLVRVMADISHVGKDGYNKSQSYNFRGIDAVLNAVGPAFRAHGIVPKPMLKDVTYETIAVGANRTPMTRCTVKVKYRFKGPGGDFEDVTVPGEAFDSGDKGTAKAMSVAYRIALIQLLALPTDEPDPDESSYERAPAAVTDQRWLAAVRQRIAAATDHDALNVIGADIGAQADAGQLSMADGNRLRAEFDARWAALTPAAPADNGWGTPQDRPAEHHHGPVDDQWNTASGQPLPPPSQSVPTATEQQIGEIVRLLGVKRRVFNGHCARAVSELVRRPVANPRTLSQAEAASIIETLTAEPDSGPPAAEPSQPGPAPVGTPDNPSITAAQQKALHAVLNKAGYGDRKQGLELLGRYIGRPLGSSTELSKAEASSIIDKLSNGELPPPDDAPEPPGPNSNGEGINEFDALDQLILDVTSQEAHDEVQQAITVEISRGTITTTGAGVLRKRLADHVAQLKAGATS